jgi:hypothetical protein
MRRPLFQGSCCRRGDESFSLTMGPLLRSRPLPPQRRSAATADIGFGNVVKILLRFTGGAAEPLPTRSPGEDENIRRPHRGIRFGT